jgi:stress response protein SCP2
MADMTKETLSDAQLAPAGVPVLGVGQKLDITGTVSVGVSWDASSRGKGGLLGKVFKKAGSDLDVVAVLFQDNEPVVLCAGWDSLVNPLHGQPGDGSVTHSGDNQTGEGEGDDETVTFHLDKIPGEFHRIVIMVAAFKDKNKKLGDQGFQGANNVLTSVYDGTGGPGAKPEFCIRPSLLGTENCVIVTVLDRVGNTTQWTMEKKNTRVRVKHGDQMDLIRQAAAVNNG